MEPLSPKLKPHHLLGAPAGAYPQGRFELSYGDDYDSGHACVASLEILDPSPTLQSTTQDPAEPPSKPNYAEQSPVEEYPQDTNTGEVSPVFVYAPPSPTRETVLPSSSRTSTPAGNHTRVRGLDPNDENIIPAIRREPITPLQPPRKPVNAKPGPWLDPDEGPVWSTLPSRSKKPKQVKTLVTTSRFRLPGAFLGSSSLLGSKNLSGSTNRPHAKGP
ncbi:hypothetical protein FS749_004781 [Ceratobasidium sp. UAMH 11750]|nr:hypothetical protein FS749_004781 [Ceratobasidium sp. UAMH 11750]